MIGDPQLRTSDRILDVALDVFVEQGFAGATITEIERRAGLAAGTGSLYRHFRSKEDVLHAAIEREVQRVMAEIDARHAASALPDEPRARATAEYRRTLTDIRRFDRLIRILLSDGHRLPALRTTITMALGSEQDRTGWAANRRSLVAVAALGGYHLLGQLADGPFQGVEEADFVDYLVEVTLGAGT